MPIVVINDSTGEFIMTRNITGVKEYKKHGTGNPNHHSIIKTTSDHDFYSPLTPLEIYERMGIKKTTIGYQSPNEN